MAAGNADIDGLLEALDNGANPNGEVEWNGSTTTAIHAACEQPDAIGCLHLMIASGAEINEKQHHSSMQRMVSPLENALLSSNHGAAILLLSASAQTDFPWLDKAYHTTPECVEVLNHILYQSLGYQTEQMPTRHELMLDDFASARQFYEEKHTLHSRAAGRETATDAGRDVIPADNPEQRGREQEIRDKYKINTDAAKARGL